MRNIVLLSLTIPLLFLSPRSAAQPDATALRIVVHADNAVPEVSAKQLARIFLRHVKVWEEWDEVPIEPVDQSRNAAVRKAFSHLVFRKSTGAIASYWQKKVFSGEDVPPDAVASDEEVLEYVSRHRGAIGYVSSATPLGSGVRSLLITDLPTAAEGYLPDRTSLAAGSAATEVLAQRGPVRILLVGSCGSRGEGRTAVLQNRDSFRAVQVTTETAYWLNGSLKSSRHRTRTLAGNEEVLLGCTRSGSGELRFSLVASSDNSVDPPPVRARHAPPRDFISLAESGTCGHQGGGHRISVVNRHPDRSILVLVESVQKVKGVQKRRSIRSHRVAPGGEKELGCSLDGALSTEYAVLEAD